MPKSCWKKTTCRQFWWKNIFRINWLIRAGHCASYQESLPCGDYYNPWRVRKPLNSKGFQNSWLFETSRLPFEKCATICSTCLNQCSCVFGSIRFAILLGESKKTKMAILNDSFIINALLGCIKCHNHFPPAILSLHFPTQDPTLNSLAGGWWWCMPKPGAIDQRVRWNSVSWSIFEGEKHWLPCTSPPAGTPPKISGLGQCWWHFQVQKPLKSFELHIGFHQKDYLLFLFPELEIIQNWSFYGLDSQLDFQGV